MRIGTPLIAFVIGFMNCGGPRLGRAMADAQCQTRVERVRLDSQVRAGSVDANKILFSHDENYTTYLLPENQETAHAIKQVAAFAQEKNLAVCIKVISSDQSEGSVVESIQIESNSIAAQRI